MGDGEITLGVAGTEERKDMLNDGSDDIQYVPETVRERQGTAIGQRVEWKCLSLRDRGMLEGERGSVGGIRISSGAMGAEPDCAAYLTGLSSSCMRQS